MPAVRVAIAVIESAGHVLVGMRQGDVALSGKAEFPGGKCHTDETSRSCVVRESREETGLMVVPRELLETITHQYDHGLIELDFWRCALSPDLDDLARGNEPFNWVALSDLRYLDFPEANRSVIRRLTKHDDSDQWPEDDELRGALEQLTEVFHCVERPEHFTDYTHCDDCLRHDQLLQTVTPEVLRLSQLGSPGMDPVTVCTDDAFRYLLPGLIRIAVTNPGQYFDRLLLQLTNERLQALSVEERNAVQLFLQTYRQRITRQLASRTGEWSVIMGAIKDDADTFPVVDEKIGKLEMMSAAEGCQE